MTTTTPATALAVRDPWALVPAIGNLDAYITAVNRIPLLTPQEEQTYAHRLREQGDLEATACRRAT
jgi:RNA polymerase sigma-32 factor